MVVFWFLAAAMAVIAAAFVVVPLLRGRPAAGPTEAQANLEVLRGHRREIEADIATGTLPAEAREEALAELVGRAADDLADAPEAPASPGAGSKPWPVAVTAGVVVPALAFAIYLAVGSPGAADPALAKAPSQLDEHQIVAMVDSLAAKMKERPDDAQGWALLARSLASLERFREAAQAYEHLAKLVPPDAQVLADHADTLGMAQGRSLRGRPAELIRQALEIDPAHRKALALAGTAAAEAGDFAAALGHWQKLASVLPADSEDARQVEQILEEVRQQAKAAGVTTPPAVAKATAPKAAAAPASTGLVSGSVAVAPEIASRLSGTETVFIFARAESGPRAPLAVVRAKARELPMKFALDDSQAMAAGMNISSAGAVRIEARVSRSGEATPRSGDFVGASAVVKPGARDVAVVVDKVVP